MRVSIVDCYTDEPAGLGVPPYLGTAPRYVFGAIVLAGHQPLYLNIDDVRAIWGEPHEPINETRDPKEALKGLRASSLLVVIGGVHTPGRYLRGTPGTPREIRRLVQEAKMPVVVGGPIVQGTMGGGRALRSDRESLGDPDHIAMGDPEAYVQRYLEVGPPPEEPVYRNYDELDRMALAGATILDQIRRGPDLICELETSRGCSRALSGGCSFCSECSRFGLPAFREASGIVAEAARLREKGVENVRLGRQACFFSYKAQRVGDLDIPIPEPAAIESLLAGCASIGFNCIHIDNVNPGVVAAYPVESEEIAKSIVTHCTPGNVAALGVESADPRVIEANNLKAMPEGSLAAVRLICKVGSRIGWNGQPAFLPGLNFVLGLPGETKETYPRNLDFLRSILQEGLILRRVNIRKVTPVRGTRLWGRRWNQKPMRLHAKSFVKMVRTEIDRPMLVRAYPIGTILRSIVAEVVDGGTSYCRFPGSYPILVGVCGRYEPRSVMDAAVIDHGFRSLTGLRFPMDINTCPPRALSMLPEIGSRRAAKILRARPIGSVVDLEWALDSDPPSSEAIRFIASLCQLGEPRP